MKKIHIVLAAEILAVAVLIHRARTPGKMVKPFAARTDPRKAIAASDVKRDRYGRAGGTAAFRPGTLT